MSAQESVIILILLYGIICMILLPSVLFSHYVLSDRTWTCTQSKLVGEEHKQKSICLTYTRNDEVENVKH